MSKKMKNIVIIGFAALILGGCNSWMGNGGPSRHAIVSHNDDYELIKVGANNIENFVGEAEAPLKKGVINTTNLDAILHPGDVIKIQIADNVSSDNVFAPLASESGGTQFDDVRIDEKGRISIPYVRNFSIAGLTLSQAQEKIQNHLKKIAVEPQVYITFTNDLGTSVLVAGNVNKPGRYSLMQGPMTLIDAISEAGGPTKAPYLTSVIIRNGRTVKRYNYQDVLDGLNFKLSPNSEIILSDTENQFIAMGAVGKAGVYDFASAHPNLLEAMGTIGGLEDSRANIKGVFLFRMPVDGALEDNVTAIDEGTAVTSKSWQRAQTKPQVFLFDMNNPMTMFLMNEFPIRPNDTIYVSNSVITNFQKFLAPIIQILYIGNYLD